MYKDRVPVSVLGDTGSKVVDVSVVGEIPAVDETPGVGEDVTTVVSSHVFSVKD